MRWSPHKAPQPALPRRCYRFSQETDPEVARRLVLVCLISPQLVGEPEQHQRLAGIVAGQELLSLLSCRERGLFAYRTGDWEGALKWCRESRQRNQEAGKEQLIKAQNFEAMALSKLNKTAEAHKSYEAAARSGSDYVRYAPHAAVGGKWVDWVMYEITAAKRLNWCLSRTTAIGPAPLTGDCLPRPREIGTRRPASSPEPASPPPPAPSWRCRLP
jgi:hypothetical protein